MIVVCSQCQARFKVADEKIGPRGAKVRCSKCQSVFVVHRELGLPPAEAQPAPAPQPAAPAMASRGGLDLDLEGEPMSGVRPSGFIADPFSSPAPARGPALDPFAAAAAQPGPPAPAADPFGGADPFASHPSASQHDPFGGHDTVPHGGASFGSVDPFVATVAAASPVPSSAVTDLSDLIGGSSATPVPSPASAYSAAPPPEQPGILETGFDFDPSAHPSPELEAAPTPLPFPGQALGGTQEPDLALAERTPASGLPARGAPAAPIPGMADFGGIEPFDAQGGMADFGGPDEDFAAGPQRAEPPRPPAPSPVPEPLPFAAAGAATAPRPAEAEPEGEDTGPEEVAARGLRHRASRWRALAINAISLVALLLVAVGLLAFWRGGRAGFGGLFRPGALVGAIGVQQAPFGADHLRSGLFDRADAAPILFVTGKAVSHAQSPVAGLRVRVELVRKGAVVAQGEVRAGATPSPEELFTSRDAEGVAAILAKLAEKAPAGVKPGDAVPFLVAIDDPPADVTEIGLHVTVEPIGEAPPEKGPSAP